MEINLIPVEEKDIPNNLFLIDIPTLDKQIRSWIKKRHPIAKEKGHEIEIMKRELLFGKDSSLYIGILYNISMLKFIPHMIYFQIQFTKNTRRKIKQMK